MIHIGQMSIMNFCKISFDFRVGSGRFRFGSFLNDRLKWSVWVVLAMLKVGASLSGSEFQVLEVPSWIETMQLKSEVFYKIFSIS